MKEITKEITKIVESLPEEKANAVAEFARQLEQADNTDERLKPKIASEILSQLNELSSQKRQ